MHYGGESAESARQKNDSANFYIGGNNRERIFYLSKITKNDSKILLSFTKDAKEIKVYVCNFLYYRHGIPGNGQKKKRGTKVPRTERRKAELMIRRDVISSAHGCAGIDAKIWVRGSSREG